MSVTRPTTLYRFLFEREMGMENTPPKKKRGDVREKRVPIVEDFHLVLGEGAIVGYGVLELEARQAKTPGAVLARKDVVRPAFAVHVPLSRDVKDVACAVCNVSARIRMTRVTDL